MGASYSGHEVIEMGIQIEKKGYKFYNFLASRAKRNALNELFTWLADQEKSHIALFEGLRSSFDNVTLNGPYNWSEVSAYFRALIDTKVFPDDDDGNTLSDEINNEIGSRVWNCCGV